MEIQRATPADTDTFTQNQLQHGACCFHTTDKTFRYYFKINGQHATLFSNTTQYLPQAIDEFLFYSGFITKILDPDGRILLTRAPAEPYLHKISDIQPSQFFISRRKLHDCNQWITRPQDIYIPIVIHNGKHIALDGHTRMRAALDLNYESLYVYPCDYDDVIFKFVDEAIQRGITSVTDMELLNEDEYKQKWGKFCDDFFAQLPNNIS